MIELFIDGKPAVIKDDTSFKLSLENQFFTKTSSYSFDVELPLAVPQNREIFGDINRIDVQKKYVELSAKLVADNLTILSGTVNITQVSEESVKVQLLGESASYKYGNKAEELYIDELPLGDWYNRTSPPSPSGIERPDNTGSSYIMTSQWQSLITNDYQAFINLIFGDLWVAYPIYNTEADTICNEYILRGYNTGPRLELPYRTPNSRESNGKPMIKVAIQPFVWYMCEIIAEATGYTLDRSKNQLYQNDFYRRIFLANANINIECNKCLPHWTVNEWWTQIEKTFGVTMILSDTDNSLALIDRNSFLSGAPTFIESVLDEYTTSIDKETFQDEIVTQNVGYADSDIYSLQERITDEILGLASINKFDSIDALKDYLNNNWAKDFKSLTKIIFEAEGRQFVAMPSSYILKEVNLFRPRIVTDNDDVDIELKFLPCTYIDYDVRVVSDSRDSEGVYLDEVLYTIQGKILSRPDKTNFSWTMSESELNNKADYVLHDMLFSEDAEVPEKEDSQDIAYLAIHAPRFDVVGDLPVMLWPRAWLHEIMTIKHTSDGGIVPNCDWEVMDKEDAGYSLSLNPSTGVRNLASEVINAATAKMETTIKHCFKFVADVIPDTSSVFVIRGKKYLCEKLEVSISSRGIDKLMTGYFFELS
ncbi:MAG: hypothetical protein IJ342_02210 [Muribaculaceae bacterium]|nr:hypothetical protein [Muribaculaceae bacterium]